MIIQSSVDKNKKLIIPLVMLIFITTSSILTFSVSVFVMQLLLACITIPLIMQKDYKTQKTYLIIFIISILFVFLVYLANQSYYGSPYYIGGSDDLMFEKWGMDVYHSNIYDSYKLLEVGVLDRWHNSPFFAVYISLLVRFSNLFDAYNTFLPRIINVYFLIWSCMLIAYFLKKYAKFSEKKVHISIMIFGLTPNIQYINSHVFRDTFNLFQILFLAYLFDKLISKKECLKKILFVVSLAFFVYITYYTRKNSLVFAGVLCFLILSEKLRLKKIYYIIILIPILMMSNFLESIGIMHFVEGYSEYVLNNAGDGLSRYVFGQRLIPFGIIFRAVYAFITPFPDFLGLFKDPSRILYDFTMFLIYFGVIIQIVFILFILKRIRKFDWLSLTFLVFFLAIIVTTFTFRHIILYYPFMVALGVDGYLSASKKTRSKNLYLSVFMGLSLSLIYVALKLFS